jgi:hypothetical protein
MCLAFAVEVNAGSLALQSTPTLNVLVSSFRGLPPWVLEGAEAEASRIFRPARISLKWIDCTSETAPSNCKSLQTAGDLEIHFVPRARPSASTTALAMTLRSPDHSAAFIFYDRIIALPTSMSFLQTMLGRVVAHEITHLLLPEEEHSSSGLMRTGKQTIYVSRVWLAELYPPGRCSFCKAKQDAEHTVSWQCIRSSSARAHATSRSRRSDSTAVRHSPALRSLLSLARFRTLQRIGR